MHDVGVRNMGEQIMITKDDPKRRREALLAKLLETADVKEAKRRMVDARQVRDQAIACFEAAARDYNETLRLGAKS